MIERVCPHCRAGNASDMAWCGACGAALEQPLARRPTGALTRRTFHLPAQWKESGKVVALGVATVAAEIGVAWLQRRWQQPPPPRPATTPAQRGRVIAIGRRVSERWSNGQLQQRSEEQVIWFAPDDRR